MGYPATVDSAGIAPQVLSVPGLESFVSSGAVGAGRAYFVCVTLYAGATVAQMRAILSGAPTGNVDMGIYDSTGTNGAPNNLLGHTGSNASATGLYTKSLSAAIPLAPGIYWLAVVDSVADTFNIRNVTSGGAAVYQTSSTALGSTLPATAGTVADTTVVPLLIGLLSGGFS